METALVGRTTEFDVLMASIESGQGAVMAGAASTGKSRLALEAAGRWKGQVCWIAATAESASVPYGALHPLVAHLVDTLKSGDSAYALMRRMLIETGDRPLLVADDAHLLDEATAAVVHALARSGEVAVLATVRDGCAVPRAITGLWKDVGLARIDVHPLGQADTRALAMQLLKGPADARTLTKVWQLSLGHPLELRELLIAARETGTLRQVDGVWTLAGPFKASPRLIELVEVRLGSLDKAERSAAETLAYGEPLDVHLLASVTGSGAVESLERAGIIRVAKTGPRPAQATFSQPLDGEVLRSTLPATRRAVLAAKLAGAARNGDVQAPDPLRVTGWRLDCGWADAAELEQAAVAAVGRMAWDLALRFGTASLELGPSYMAHRSVATALAELGDPGEAETHLLLAKELVDDPAMKARVTIMLADVWFYHAGRMEEALELLRKELEPPTQRSARNLRVRSPST